MDTHIKKSKLQGSSSKFTLKREHSHVTHTSSSKLGKKEKENEAEGPYETPWKDKRSRRVSKIDEAAVFCAKLNFNRPSNSPSFA